MAERLKLGVLCGGRSGEHEVSIMSARSVYSALDQERFEPVLVGISKKGTWFLCEDPEFVFSEGKIGPACGPAVTIIGHPSENRFVTLEGQPLPELDVVFPVLHGTFGEDGTVQGLLELAGVPYVGAGVLASSVGMDKAVAKSVFRQAGLPVVEDILINRKSLRADPSGTAALVEDSIPYPCFIKPANLGSSVGISKAKNHLELQHALAEAAKFDRRLIVERGVEAREIECSVLGNDDPEASVPGEIIPTREFYDYEAKYVSDDSELVIPAPLEAAQEKQVRKMAVAAFKAIDCAGLARVDFFIDKGTGQIYLNEINTMPGFTKISMYPKLWEASGMPYVQLLTRLVELALERFADRQEIQTNR